MNRNITQRIGKNIAHARKASGRTQAEIAERIGIDTVSLSRIERGVVTPSISTLEKIADELNISILLFFDGAASNTASLADCIISHLEPLHKDDRLFLLEQIKLWAQKLSPD